MGIKGIRSIGYFNEDGRRAGLLAIAKRIQAENPKIRDADLMAKAKNEWHRLEAAKKERAR